jgi:hypothetical protein
MSSLLAYSGPSLTCGCIAANASVGFVNVCPNPQRRVAALLAATASSLPAGYEPTEVAFSATTPAALRMICPEPANMKFLETMKRQPRLFAAVALLALSTLAAAQDRGYWRAASSNAASITGDIALSNSKITINFATFPFVQVRRLKPAEVSSVFDADVNAGIEGTLYRLRVPANKKFLHHNTLCGDELTTWMATYVAGRSMQVAFFSGDTEPVFKFGAIQNSPALCGVYTYVR